MGKYILRTLGSLVLVVVILALIYQTELRQLYNTVHLFDTDRIVTNFSRLKDMAPTKVLFSNDSIRSLNPIPRQLPRSFMYKGEEITIAKWLEDSNTTALVVIQGENLLHEQYLQGTGEFDQRISWSMAKSFLSALFGVAVAEGKVPDLNAAVTDYVPSLVGSGYDGISIKNVLQMSSGVYFNEDYGDFNSDINRFGRIMALGGSFDDFATSLTQDPLHEPGKFMHYVSIDTHVLGMVLRAATGKTIMEYMQEKLWSKLGAESDAYFITDSTGEPMVLGGLNMISRDYARMGMLYRDFGQYNGKQIIEKQWVIDSTTPDAPHLMPGPRANASRTLGYGYQWWLPINPDQEFMAVGIYGQFIFIDRKKDLVIVKNSADRHFMENNFQSTDLSISAFRAISESL
ncbi:serine hydrolase [Oceaniserpentilla sp. 4NH20-0058]|uniref:serine hydrolase domain-containing protein n=1 Tax=Oceaniserpentilla sp. 4NH20-0058 TaxID=3127660 RepID=UPI00310AA3C8